MRAQEDGKEANMNSAIDIRPITHEDIDSFAQTLGAVIEERQYLAATSPPPLKQITDFVKKNIHGGYPQLIAVQHETVAGWCDAIPLSPTERSHVARLGMGVLTDFRGQGIGRALITRCLALSAEFGFEKVELDVYSDNYTARSLYTSIGFEVEGTRRKSRKLDGQYQDIVLMGKFLHHTDSATEDPTGQHSTAVETNLAAVTRFNSTGSE